MEILDIHMYTYEGWGFGLKYHPLEICLKAKYNDYENFKRITSCLIQTHPPKFFSEHT